MKNPACSDHSASTVRRISLASHHVADSNDALDVVAIYREHADFVWRTLQRMGVDEHHLDDVSQEVFVVVMRKLSTFDGSSLMTTWLYGICLRVASSWRKRAWRHREQSVEDPSDWDPGGAGGDEQMGNHEARRRLQAVLDRMDVDKRAVFVMFEVEELSTSEMAVLLGVPPGTVHSRLHAAREQFQLILSRLRAKAFRGDGR